MMGLDRLRALRCLLFCHPSVLMWRDEGLRRRWRMQCDHHRVTISEGDAWCAQ